MAGLSSRRRWAPVASTRARIQKVFARVACPAGLDEGLLRRMAARKVGHLPVWVGEVGALEAPGAWCLWCRPRRSPGETFPSQVILDLPAGRYMVETLDARTGTWCARESATGGPLVAGLPFTGGPALVVIRTIARAEPAL